MTTYAAYLIQNVGRYIPFSGRPKDMSERKKLPPLPPPPVLTPLSSSSLSPVSSPIWEPPFKREKATTISTKCKATAAPRKTTNSAKRTKTAGNKPKLTLVWAERKWRVKKNIYDNIDIMSNKDTPKLLVVKKALRHSSCSDGEQKHFEVQALEMLPPCNRIVQMIGYVHNYPDSDFGTVFFDFYPLGDVHHWKEEHFDQKNFKMVPESYIWRFFIQMTQALAFIHNIIGPDRGRGGIIHRDIKPKNVLVVNNGTTYPSFKLHDFGCATIYTPEKAQIGALCGTFEWQPPENPMINTATADVWSMGACVHYIATGEAPVQSIAHFEREVRSREGDNPRAAHDYSTRKHYYNARVPRIVTPINLTEQQQEKIGIAPYSGTNRRRYNHQYSDALNMWMFQALHFDQKARATVQDLLSKMIPEAIEMLRASSGKAGLSDLEIRFDV